MAALLDIDTKAAYYSGDAAPVYSDRGRVLCAWIHESVVSLKDMPRIRNELLRIVVYLYPSKACAENGEQLGGSGFLVLVSSETHTAQAYVYAVTNRHVVEHGASVIRFNTKVGGSDVPTLDGNWETHPEGDDVAAIFIGGIDPASDYKNLAMSNEEFLTQEIIEHEAIGPGDDVFMIGRFMGHDGKQKNLPSVRFGNISMMPDEPIKHEGGFQQESFVIESRSIPGYSGSPVFVYTKPLIHDRDSVVHLGGGPWLLGIDWGHQPIFERVLQDDKRTPAQERYWVASNSGMMNVIPAWRIQTLLDHPNFVKARSEADAKITAIKEQERTAVLDDGEK